MKVKKKKLSNVVNQPQKDMYHWKAEYWVSTFHLICRTAHGKEAIIGYIFRQYGEVKWPPIGLKHWKVEYWSHYLSFDMSHDMGYAKVIIVVMEVIWGHVFGHGEVKWPPIGLKHWQVEYWSHYLSFDMSHDMG